MKSITLKEILFYYKLTGELPSNLYLKIIDCEYDNKEKCQCIGKLCTPTSLEFKEKSSGFIIRFLGEVSSPFGSHNNSNCYFYSKPSDQHQLDKAEFYIGDLDD